MNCNGNNDIENKMISSQLYDDKIGILGGTFDPIHNGHLSIAMAAMKEYELSKLQATVQAIGTIFVNRSSKPSGKTARRTMIQTLLHGGNVLIFPEGTRNKTEQILLPFHYGAVRIAGKIGAPIVPIVIKKLGKKSFRIVIGKSMQVGAGDVLEERNRELWECMRGMVEEVEVDGSLKESE